MINITDRHNDKNPAGIILRGDLKDKWIKACDIIKKQHKIDNLKGTKILNQILDDFLESVKK